MHHTLSSLYKINIQKLNAIYPHEESRAMADRLFEHFFMLTPAGRVISGADNVDEMIIMAMDAAVGKLLNHVPLQYVLGKACFMDMDFLVDGSVLIPRPETEELVSLILAENSKIAHLPLRILDIGTGSGCIAIALKRNIPDSVITAIDISEKALQVAQANAESNMATVSFIRADILDQTRWGQFAGFDLIVSNPPYVTHAEKGQMLPNVLDYEPHNALFVPDDDPLVFYRQIMIFALTQLSAEGSLWFEINEMFGSELKNLASSLGFHEVNIIFDFRGKSRFLQCSKKNYSNSLNY